MPKRAIEGRVARVQTYCKTEGGVCCLPIPIHQPVHVPVDELRLSEVGVGAYGMRGGVSRARPHVEWSSIAIDYASCVGERQTGPRERVVRVEDNRTLVLLDRRIVGHARSPAFEIPPAQVRVVSVCVLCLP